jgi:VanZ family protein
MILGVLVANCLLNTNVPKPRLFLLALLICILYAISDEIHQMFIPGRSGQVSDVLIDSTGGLVGILGLSAIRRRKSKI